VGKIVVFTKKDEKEFTKKAGTRKAIEKEVFLSNKEGQVIPKETLLDKKLSYYRMN